jgi:hypothetical protein
LFVPSFAKMSMHYEAPRSAIASEPAETEGRVTARNITSTMAIIAKVVATIVAIPLLPMVLRVYLSRYQSMTWSQGGASCLLVLLPFWVVLWRREVTPERRVVGFAAGLGTGVVLFVAGDLIKGLVIARTPDPEFRITPFIGYQILTFASWTVAGLLTYWIAAPATARQK